MEKVKKKKKTQKSTYICVKLANKAREVVMFEEGGEEICCKLLRPPHDKRCSIRVPRYDVVRRRILNKHVGFGQERRRSRLSGGADVVLTHIT